MAVTKASNSGIKTGVLKYDSMLAGNPAYDPAATWLISRTTLSSDTASVTFSSIPSTYQHLQVRWLARNTDAITYTDLNISPNGSGLVTNHKIIGEGAGSPIATGATSNGAIYLTDAITGANATANIFGVGIMDIHDYASTTKNKTFRVFAGQDQNTANGRVLLASSLGTGIGTAALTSLVFTCSANFKAGSTFALYGYKGA